MNKYQATDSQGNTYKRASKNRTYTHAIVATWSSGYVEVTWAGSPELAAARVKTFDNKRNMIGKKDRTGWTWTNEVVNVELLEAVAQ